MKLNIKKAFKKLFGIKPLWNEEKEYPRYWIYVVNPVTGLKVYGPYVNYYHAQIHSDRIGGQGEIVGSELGVTKTEMVKRVKEAIA